MLCDIIMAMGNEIEPLPKPLDESESSSSTHKCAIGKLPPCSLGVLSGEKNVGTARW